jgi:hypothetical protein
VSALRLCTSCVDCMGARVVLVWTRVDTLFVSPRARHTFKTNKRTADLLGCAIHYACALCIVSLYRWDNVRPWRVVFKSGCPQVFCVAQLFTLLCGRWTCVWVWIARCRVVACTVAYLSLFLLRLISLGERRRTPTGTQAPCHSRSKRVCGQKRGFNGFILFLYYLYFFYTFFA